MNEYDYIIDAFTRDGNNTNLEVDNLTVGCISSANNNFSLDSSGNLTVNSITVQSGPTIDFDSIYPIGSIYLTVGSTSPATLFGGTWERIKDCFLLASGDTYQAGTTGGESSHVLTINEMPIHNHTNSVATNGGHSHTGHTKEVRAQVSGQPSNDCARNISSSYDHSGITITDAAGSHSHSVTINNAGGGVAHNNMPPYLTVYVWKRTA